MKVVINTCYGGFELSDEAIEMVMNRKGYGCYRYRRTKSSFDYEGVSEYTKCDKFSKNDLFTHYLKEDLGDKINNIPNNVYWHYGNLERNDSDLVAVVEELGDKANGQFSKLKIVEVPDDINWEIDDYDGIESIHEVHRTWY